MPVNSKGRFYPAAEKCNRAEFVGIVTADGALSTFEVGDLANLEATLTVSSHLVIDPTGSNNTIHIVAVGTADQSDIKVAIGTPSGSSTVVTIGNETQVVTITGTPTGGTFTLTFGGQTTSALAYNAAASAVETALNALSSIGADGVAVSGSAGGPYTVTFDGTAFAGTDVALMTADGSGLTGGTTPDVTVDTAAITITATPGTASTAAEVVTAINNKEYINSLIRAKNADAGTGTMAAVAAAALAAVPAGTNPTLDIQLEHSVDGTTWFDVAGTNANTGHFTRAVDARSTEARAIPVPGSGWLRWVADIGGTNSPAFGVTITANGRSIAW